MKKLLESVQEIEECGIDEGPMPTPMTPPVADGDPVRMNVNLSAAGKDHVADLIDMMKNAGLGNAKPVDAKMLAPRLDMERLRSIVDKPMDDPDIPGKDDVEGDKDLTAMGCNDDMEYEEGYANEPEEEFGDMSDAIPDGDDLNRKKKQFKAAQPGDNAMAMENIKAQLYAALAEKKAKPDFLDMDGDGDKKEPMKKAIKDKESKKKNEGKQKGVDGKACWDGYKRMGTKKKGGKTVDNCVPMSAKEKNK